MQLPAYHTLVASIEGGVLTVTLNRPDSLNAINEQMATELNDAVGLAERAAEVRCIVVTGAGRGFCSGQDLRDRAGTSGISYGELLRTRLNPIVLGLRVLEKPVIAAVNGVAAGAGCSLALAADLRIASDRASFALSFSRIGLIPDGGATFFLPRLVGLARTLEIAFSGEPVPAAEALRLGLVNRVVPHDDLPAQASQLALRLAVGPTRAFGLAKRAVNAGLSGSLDAALENEALLQGIAGQTADHREGLAAFLEKRPPRFEGR
ncbi:MAG: enoyl-CoA hydratase-related protein [bacterium]|nr:enoyl-CoA hydratase-related protein [bacterium]